MLHAYRLVYPISQHAPPQLWEYEQPYIDNLLSNARTFARWVVQWYCADWGALDLPIRSINFHYSVFQAVDTEPLPSLVETGSPAATPIRASTNAGFPPQ